MGTLLLPMAIAALAGTWATREPLWGALAAVPVLGWQVFAWREAGRALDTRRAIALIPLVAALAGAAWIGAPLDIAPPGREGERVCIVGRLVEAPRLSELVDPREVAGSQWLGSAIVTTEAGARVRLQLYMWVGQLGPGDRVQATGRLSGVRAARNPGEFDTATYAGRLGIGWTVAVRHPGDLQLLEAGRWSVARHAWRARMELSRRIAHRYAEPERGLIAALALGRADALDPGLQEGLSETGLLHALAVSGMHLVLLAWMARRPIGLIARRPVIRDAVVVVLLASYAALVGFCPSVVRSLAAAAYVAAGGALGRRITAGGAFGASLLACLVVDPRQSFELGFVLSFTSILGLAALDGVLGSGARPRAVAAACAAWIATAPPSAGLFGRLAPWGIPLSVLIVAPMAVLLALALADCVVGELVPLAPIVGAMARALIWATGYCERMDLPASRACWVLAVPGYWALASRLLVPGAKGELTRRFGMALLLAPVALALWPRSQGRNELWVLDGGRAHAVVVLDADGGTTLVDAGMVGDPFLEARILRPALRALRVGRLDRVVLANSSGRHERGRPRIATRIAAREVWTPALREDRALLADWLGRGAQLRWLSPGEGHMSGTGTGRIGWWASSGGGLAVVVGAGPTRFAIASGIGADGLREAIAAATPPSAPRALVVLGEFPVGTDAGRLARASGAPLALAARDGDPPLGWRRRCGRMGMPVRWTAMDGALTLTDGTEPGAEMVRGWCWRPR